MSPGCGGKSGRLLVLRQCGYTFLEHSGAPLLMNVPQEVGGHRSMAEVEL